VNIIWEVNNEIWFFVFFFELELQLSLAVRTNENNKKFLSYINWLCALRYSLRYEFPLFSSILLLLYVRTIFNHSFVRNGRRKYYSDMIHNNNSYGIIWNLVLCKWKEKPSYKFSHRSNNIPLRQIMKFLYGVYRIYIILRACDAKIERGSRAYTYSDFSSLSYHNKYLPRAHIRLTVYILRSTSQ